MYKIFRSGAGWWLAKHYLQLTKPITDRLLDNGVRNHRRQLSDQRSEDLDLLIPDERRKRAEPIDQIRYVSLRIVEILYHLGNKHGFSFQLAYGTLLGAIRHGGFIPWDDDIDVFMTEKDFARFREVVHELPDSLTLFRNNHDFWKLMDRYSQVSEASSGGIAVDIFILNKASEDTFCFLNVHGYRYTYLPKNDLFPLRTTEFSGTALPLPIPAHPEKILKRIYGDWRKLPPEEERIYPHLGEEIVIRSHGEQAIHGHPYL